MTTLRTIIVCGAPNGSAGGGLTYDLTVNDAASTMASGATFLEVYNAVKLTYPSTTMQTASGYSVMVIDLGLEAVSAAPTLTTTNTSTGVVKSYPTKAITMADVGDVELHVESGFSNAVTLTAVALAVALAAS